MILVALGLWLVGCASAPQTSTVKGRFYQTQIFENTSYASVFGAARSLLQDEGYVVKNQDKQGGHIVARIERPNLSSGPRDFAGLDGGSADIKPEASHHERSGAGYEISLNFKPVDETRVQVHMSIQQVEFFNHGGRRGSVIVSEESYKSFFDLLISEVEQRNLGGRV